MTTAIRSLDDRDRAELASLVQEYLLIGHLIDRAGMPQLIASYGLEPMRDVAIDEWMGASPIYSARMRRALGFDGDDVETIFKGIQFDIGSPPQFMDFRFEVVDRDHGEFWLAHCGALMDVEPMGEEFVVAMCHDIEDPTFDATALATNPRARVRPVHRPPREPADRQPHCHWTVAIDSDNEPIGERDVTLRMRDTLAAHWEPPERTVEPDDDGRRDYRGPLIDDVALTDFARTTLLAVADEVCLQGQLLTMSFLAAVDDRFGREAARTIGRRQFEGVAGVGAARLHAALGRPGGAGGIAEVLELHPAFHPRGYVDARVELAGELVRFSLGDCDARREPLGFAPPGLLDAEHSEPLHAIVTAVDPTARVHPRGEDAGRVIWEVDLGAQAAPVPEAVVLTRFSTGADFVFRPRVAGRPTTEPRGTASRPADAAG